MQPKSKRRVHGAEFKAQVLAECRQPGASVAAVSLKHGLNVNLVRKWLVGRGIKRTGPAECIDAVPSAGMIPPTLQFQPLDLDARSAGMSATVMEPEAVIEIAVSRGQTQLSVQWPASHAAACGLWLRDLVAVSK